MKPWISDPDFDLYIGDVLEVLRQLPSESVHSVLTSPPYWALRDYGTGVWEGGNPECDHLIPVGGDGKSTLNCDPDSQRRSQMRQQTPYRGTCRKCGAYRTDHQIGLEATPEEYVTSLTEVFREVWRVLRRDGTCWLNLGDSYNSNPAGRLPGGFQGQQIQADSEYDETTPRHVAGTRGPGLGKSKVRGLKPKDLVGIPWRVAFNLQADGWWLRSDIVWSKSNPMPESARDRPTHSHEFVFLLTKAASYWYDAEAISEPAEWNRWGDQTIGPGSNPNGWIPAKSKKELTWTERKELGEPMRHGMSGEKPSYSVAGGREFRNKRSVWQIPTESYEGAHFAVMPMALAELCIKAGCPERGTVLDPFLGSGTTALVARRLGRKCVGIELSQSYAELAAKRLQQLSLLA